MLKPIKIKFDPCIIVDNPEEVFHDYIEDGFSERDAIRGLIADGIVNYIMETKHPEFNDVHRCIHEVEIGTYEVEEI